MSDPTASAAPEKASVIEDFIDIWSSPSKVFARRSEGEFAVALVITTILISALMFIARDAWGAMFNAEVARGMAQASSGQQLTAEQMAGVRKFYNAIAAYGGIVTIPLSVLVLAIGVWITGKLVGAEELGYGKSAMISTYSMAPKILGALLMAVQGLLLDPATIKGAFSWSFGVARFLDPEKVQAGIVQLAARVDPFTIWSSILIGIGLVTVGKLGKEKVMTAALIIWAIGSVGAIWALIMAALRG